MNVYVCVTPFHNARALSSITFTLRILLVTAVHS